MKVTVKTYGTLKPPSAADPTLPANEMEMPEGTRVADLLTRLGITPGQGGTVVMNGRLLPREEELIDGALIQVFPVMHGG
ncbi:MAG: MoaD/ThiS family protein [Desulfobacterota bacterium]|jgi:sulfur carrier protein ThiS|nr:MoaD/ThiS family protein [Thermodesulfobacteriota bacterium]